MNKNALLLSDGLVMVLCISCSVSSTYTWARGAGPQVVDFQQLTLGSSSKENSCKE
jgi:hypothetical protein